MKDNATLQSVLTGLALSLTALHNTGVKLGHFGSTDFIALAEQISLEVLSGFALPTPAAQAAS